MKKDVQFRTVSNVQVGAFEKMFNEYVFESEYACDRNIPENARDTQGS